MCLNIDKNNKNNNFRHFCCTMKGLLLVQKSRKLNSKTFFSRKKLSIITLIEEIKPIVLEEYEIEKGNKPKLVPFFGTFGLSKYRRKDEVI